MVRLLDLSRISFHRCIDGSRYLQPGMKMVFLTGADAVPGFLLVATAVATFPLDDPVPTAAAIAAALAIAGPLFTLSLSSPSPAADNLGFFACGEDFCSTSSTVTSGERERLILVWTELTILCAWQRVLYGRMDLRIINSRMKTRYKS